jgi:hypothetical protein
VFAHAQAIKPASAPKPAPSIADNSFLVEEAYNQERGVVQHISTFVRGRSANWAYAFTQEWPAPSQLHQLSYTIPILHPGASSTGIGDVALNYRYQALGKDDEPLWFSPRFSVFLPTGDVLKGLGGGGVGVEVMLPLSYQLSDAVVTHWNAAGLISRAENALGTKGTLTGVRAAASAIWLVAPTFNLMLESTYGHVESSFSGRTSGVDAFVVSPGMRGAFNFASGLQIVPGIAFPIGFGPSDGQRDLFLYLSFEHAFR